MKCGEVHKKGEVSLMDIISEVKKNPDFYKAGGIACFIGVVRGETRDGIPVEKLELEAYEEKANEILTNICEDIKKEKGIISVQIHHNLGEFKVGEEIVYVVIAGTHRKELFSALFNAVERYKKEAPIWKAAYD
ncbi:MAG: molybdenum cofactor biosynthesis protein MoaE [Candidatus Jordarchaeaceae archaeon]